MVRLKRTLLIALTAALVIGFGYPLAIATMQDETPSPTLDITGINPTDLPTTFTVITDVTDSLGQPVQGLELEDFTLSGDLADRASIVSVENVTDDNLTFAVVLVIDTSSSMAGNGADAPIAQAQAAAIEFVNNIGDGNPVAIITFNDEVNLLQDFTTDRAALLNTLNNLPFGGETDLYSAAVAGIEKAAESGNPRRAVIILSDGAQYLVSGTAESAREDALTSAIVNGVPVYTIGLGYGTDRTYLDSLAGGTNARFYESPTPNQLTEIYDGLARLLRSQYIVTVGLNEDVPLDGTEYEVGLQATTPEGATNTDTATLRVPIPVPVVSVEPLPDAPLTEPTQFTALTRSDDALAAQGFQLTGAAAFLDFAGIGEITTSQTVAFESVETFTLDPFTLLPGDYTLVYTVTDETDDMTTVEVPVSIAALPAVVTLSPDVASLGEISEPTTFTVALSEQTPTQNVQFVVDGETVADLTTAPFSYDLNPLDFAPGVHTLEVIVTSASGASTSTSSEFTIAALAPEVAVSGLEPNAVLTEATTVEVEIRGQTPARSVAFAIDGTMLATDTEAPYSITLEPLDFAPDQIYTLQITSTNAGGASTTTEIPFSFDLAPFLTATPPTYTPTATFTPTFTPTPTVDLAATQALETQVALLTVEAQNTADALATVGAEQTANAIATFDFFSTQTANETATRIAAEADETQTADDAQATANAQATLTNDAVLTAQAVFTLDAEATLDAQATADAQATLDTQVSANLQATADAEATVNAQATADAQATSNRDMVATLSAQRTANAEANATLDALLTIEAQQTVNAQRTAAMNITATADQDMAATLDAQATVDAQATIDTQATADAELTATAVQIAAIAQATRERPSATPMPPTETPTDALTAIPTTAEPSPEPSLEPSATETIAATNTVAPTDTAEPTLTPTEAAPAATATVFDATVTPSTPTEIIAQGAAQADNSIAFLAIGCGILIFILLVALYLIARRRREQQS